MSARVFVLFVVMSFIHADFAAAQSHAPPQPPAKPEDPHQHHPTAEGIVIPHEREGSGTSWLPDATPMYAIHGSPFGGWETMLHGVAVLQYLRDADPRGHDQFGSVSWLMGHARRRGDFGDLALRGMFSLEPLTIRGCGYPDLLASGEVCDGHVIFDQQHPHDLVMELAALYGRPLSNRLALQIYAGVAGEPALGPVAFPHRMSAMMNPLAPVSHHWLDATHIVFGVVTGGVHARAWKIESSLFNGREPDEDRYDVNLAAFDSFSARVTLLPTTRWALQVSAGHLEESEDDVVRRVDVDRITASAIHHSPRENGGLLATTIAWGRNLEEGQPSHAVLAESTLSLHDRHVIFARGELVQKSGHDLDLHATPDEMFTVGKLQGGYSRFFRPLRGWRPGVGVSVALSSVPASLSAVYGGRITPGVAVFATLRPAAMKH